MQLTSHVIPTVVEQRNLTMRFKLLEDTRQEAETALPVLERHVDSSVLPLPRTVRSSALAADNLLKALAAAYFDIAKTIAKSGHQRGYVHLLQRTVNRAMLLIARRQNLAYSSYTSPSSTSWLMLHELYQIVRDLRAIHPETNITPLEQQYLSTLLFAYHRPQQVATRRVDGRNFLHTATGGACRHRQSHARYTHMQSGLPLLPGTPGRGKPRRAAAPPAKRNANSGRLYRRLYSCPRSAQQVRRACRLWLQ